MGPVIARDAGAAGSARYLSVTPSQQWDGSIGRWSSFSLGLGQPLQDVRVLVSTASTTAWTIDASSGCPKDFAVADCNASRGGLYDVAKSSSFKVIGPSSIDAGEVAAVDKSASAGFENLTISGLDVTGSSSIVVNHQAVDVYNGTAFWLGGLGLNPRLKSGPADEKSLLQSLKEAGHISSLAYGYGEGAFYRGETTFGSLTLGGYDQSLFRPTNISFPIRVADAKDLAVGLQSIRTRNPSTPLGMEMLNQPIYALIDSTLPEIWLPKATCQSFESTFNLTHNATSGLYFLSESQHSALLKANPSVSFYVGPDADIGTRYVNITLPYAAFDLNASWPLVGASSAPKGQRYFPLRQTDDETQYRLGRTFLQEAYLIADYEQANFTLAPRVWDTSRQPDLKAVSAMDISTSPGQAMSVPSFNTIAGIVIGCIGGILVLLFTSMLLLLRRRREQIRRMKARRDQSHTHTDQSLLTSRYSTSRYSATELKDTFMKSPQHEHWYFSAQPPISGHAALQHHPQRHNTMDTIREASPPPLTSNPIEMAAEPIHRNELEGSVTPTELEARPSPSQSLSHSPCHSPIEGPGTGDLGSYFPTALSRSNTLNTHSWTDSNSVSRSASLTLSRSGTTRSNSSLRTRLSIPAVVVEEESSPIGQDGSNSKGAENAKEKSEQTLSMPVELPAALPAELLARRRTEIERNETRRPKRNKTR